MTSPEYRRFLHELERPLISREDHEHSHLDAILHLQGEEARQARQRLIARISQPDCCDLRIVEVLLKLAEPALIAVLHQVRARARATTQLEVLLACALGLPAVDPSYDSRDDLLHIAGGTGWCRGSPRIKALRQLSHQAPAASLEPGLHLLVAGPQAGVRRQEVLQCLLVALGRRAGPLRKGSWHAATHKLLGMGEGTAGLARGIARTQRMVADVRADRTRLQRYLGPRR